MPPVSPAGPWRYSASGLSVAVRVTPRGGRDGIDGIDTMSDGRSVLKVRVKAIADGGEANRAVIRLLAKTAGVTQSDVSVLSGATSRLKQIAIAGDPQRIAAELEKAARKDA